MAGVAGPPGGVPSYPGDATLLLLLKVTGNIERAPLDPKYRRLNTRAGSKFHCLGMAAGLARLLAALYRTARPAEPRRPRGPSPALQ